MGLNAIKVCGIPGSKAVLCCSIGSIVDFRGNAIVNAANQGCLSGGGVDAVVTRAGGEALAQARRNLPFLRSPTGKVRCAVQSARAGSLLAENSKCRGVFMQLDLATTRR